MTDWTVFLGRFHPLVLHFPIALLSAAFVLTLAGRNPRFSRLERAGVLSLQLGALGAVVSAVLGFLLAQEGGYDETIVALHRWSGISLAALSVVLVWLRRRPGLSRAYLPVFTVCVLLLMWVGHLGGTLTHGRGYLLAHAPSPVRALFGADAAGSGGAVVVENVERAVVLDDLILPVLEATCTECHNPIKRKSGFDLTTADGLLAGGEMGPAITEDGALNSALFRRLILPAEHEDAMPPAGRARLAPVDVELIGWWLDEGAPLDATVSSLSPDSRRLLMLRERFGRPNPLASLRIAPASERALERANRGPYIVEPVSADEPYLRARLRPEPGGEPPSLDVLRRVRDQLIELDVADSGFDDEAATGLATFEHLQRLAVQNTAVTDAAMRYVADLRYLERLNIHGTGVTVAGLRALNRLEHLSDLYAWNSITGATLAEAAASLPGVHIDIGVDQARFAATQLPPPIISADSTLFVTRATVSLTGSIPGTEVYFTLDGSPPTPESGRYDEPFTVENSVRVRAIGTRDGWETSPVAEAGLLKRGLAPQAARLVTTPNPEYPGEGGSTLVDGALGTLTFRTPRWLGYRETDLVAEIDLGAVETVGEVTVSILETMESWIFPPSTLEISLSIDGDSFRRAASARFDTPTGSRAPSQSFLTERFEPTQARWVRVRLGNLERLPEWHPGAGEPAWLFVDEVLVGRGTTDDLFWHECPSNTCP